MNMPAYSLTRCTGCFADSSDVHLSRSSSSTDCQDEHSSSASTLVSAKLPPIKTCPVSTCCTTNNTRQLTQRASSLASSSSAALRIDGLVGGATEAAKGLELPLHTCFGSLDLGGSGVIGNMASLDAAKAYNVTVAACHELCHQGRWDGTGSKQNPLYAQHVWLAAQRAAGYGLPSAMPAQHHPLALSAVSKEQLTDPYRHLHHPGLLGGDHLRGHASGHVSAVARDAACSAWAHSIASAAAAAAAGMECARPRSAIPGTSTINPLGQSLPCMPPSGEARLPLPPKALLPHNRWTIR